MGDEMIDRAAVVERVAPYHTALRANRSRVAECPGFLTGDNDAELLQEGGAVALDAGGLGGDEDRVFRRAGEGFDGVAGGKVFVNDQPVVNTFGGVEEEEAITPTVGAAGETFPPFFGSGVEGGFGKKLYPNRALSMKLVRGGGHQAGRKI